MKLHPVNYRLKDWPNDPKLGFIAREAVKVVPEAVSLDPEIQFLRVYRVGRAFCATTAGNR